MGRWRTFCACLRSVVSEHASGLRERVERQPLHDGAAGHTPQAEGTGPERRRGGVRGGERGGGERGMRRGGDREGKRGMRGRWLEREGLTGGEGVVVKGERGRGGRYPGPH